MNTLRNMKIKSKITVSFTLGNLLFLIVCIYAIILNVTFGARYEATFEDYGCVSGEVGMAHADYYNALYNVSELVQTDDPVVLAEKVTECKETINNMHAVLDGAMAKTSDAEVLTIYKTLCDSMDAMEVDATNILTSAASGDVAAARAIYMSDSYSRHEATISAGYAELYNTLQTKGQEVIEELASTRNGAILISIIGALITIVLVVVIAKVVSFSLKVPAWNMQEAAGKMAVGDIDVEIKHMYNDELGELADELNVMVENIKTQSKVAHEVSEGNLTVEVIPKSAKDKLGNALYNMVSEENRVMTGIKEAVNEIKTGSEQVAAASQSLAQGSTEQASAIEEITASINEITDRTKVNASDAGEANNLVAQCKSDAQTGNGKMNEMISAMTEINDSSENISKIIKVIDDIAFQTNILALNAAVEAARAGQHGKGFAVVADEVRNLAGKSAQAASETAEMIEDSIAKVTKGSRLAEETASALSGIVGAIDRILHLTNAIAVASNDQATAIAQIDQAINQVSQVVQTNSATSEQCAAASEELSAQAGKLRDMISRYRLKRTKEQSYIAGGYTAVADNNTKYEEATPVISLDDGFGKY